MRHNSADERKLLITDSLDLAWVAKVAPLPGKAALLTFGVSAEAILESNPKILEKVPGLYALDTHSLSKGAAEEVQIFIPRLMRKIHTEFRSDLRIKGRSYWRYLLVSEKNIWLGSRTAIHRLYAVDRTDRAIADFKPEKVLLALKDEVLLEVLKKAFLQKGIEHEVVVDPPRMTRKHQQKRSFFALKYYQLAAQAARRIVRLSRDFAHLEMPTNPSGTGTTIYSIYPAFFADPFSSSGIKERFFQDLPESLSASGKSIFLTSLSDETCLREKKEDVERIFETSGIYPIERHSAWSDVLELLDPRVFWAAFRFCEKLRKADLFRFRGYDVTPFVREDILFSWLDPSFFRSLSIELSLRRCLKELKPKAFLFRLEFQPFEYALLRACKDLVRTVGFQHSAASRNFMSYVFDPGELEHSEFPMPDHIFTTGPAGKRLLVDAGFPGTKITVVGPVRYRGISTYLKKKLSKESLRQKLEIPSGKAMIYVAAAPIFGETVSMLTALFKTIRKSPEKYYIVFKTHPSETDFELFKTMFEQNLEGGTYRLMKGVIPFYDYVCASDTVLLTGSTVGAEAMALGVIPIVFECSAQLGNNSLADHPKSAFLAHDALSLEKALYAIQQEPEKVAEAKEHWPTALKSLFDDFSVDPNSRFISELGRFVQRASAQTAESTPNTAT